MKHATLATAATLLALGGLAGCGNDTPTQAEIDAASQQIRATVDAVSNARVAEQLLAWFPIYTCGAPGHTFVQDVGTKLEANYACLDAEPGRDDQGRETLAVRFHDGGCAIDGHTLTGAVGFTYEGGEERFSATADWRGMALDGRPVQAVSGYSVCGGENQFWVRASGSLEGLDGVTFDVDGALVLREGLPYVGETTLVLAGRGSVTTAAGANEAVIDDLTYDVGDYLPRGGSLRIRTADGHDVFVAFDGDVPVLDKVRVSIDDEKSFEVTLVH